jgi:transaldolase
MSLLDHLRQRSEIAAESADIQSFADLDVHHAILSASRITAAAQDERHGDIVDAAVRWAQKEVGKGGNRKMVAVRAVEGLAVEFARKLLEVVRGDVSLEVDGRLAYQRRPTIERARAMHAQLNGLGADVSRILFMIPATWEGIEAARKLAEKDGIRCHLTLVFGMHQLAAAAAAKAAVISPAVGRISDFYRKKDGVEAFDPAHDPGVILTARMADYLVHHGRDSVLMPSTFRGREQAAALAGMQRLSLPPALLAELAEAEGELAVPSWEATTPEPLTIDSGRFQALHAADPVASQKLQSGVKNLSWAVLSQEKQLAEWITRRQDHAVASSAYELFKIWDYDGDGFIDREEWGGSDEVFNALDKNRDGRITLEEMALGLGAPQRHD